MYNQLGATIFTGLFSYSDFERKAKKEYAQLPLINSKPDLQSIGTALEVIELTIKLHESFCNPTARYQELKAYCDNGDILPFLDGYGNLIGTYVIEELTEAVTQTDRRGAVTLCECKATLLEYVDPDRTLTQAIKAKQNAFALNSPPLSVVSTGFLPVGAVSVLNAMLPVNANITGAIVQVNAANVSPATAALSVSQAINSINAVVASVQDAIDKAVAYVAQGYSAGNGFVNAAMAVHGNAVTALAALKSGNIAAALTDVTVLGQSSNELNTIGLPLQQLLILR